MDTSPEPSCLQPLLALPHSLPFLVMSATRGRSQMPLKLGLPSGRCGRAAVWSFAAADWPSAGTIVNPQIATSDAREQLKRILIFTPVSYFWPTAERGTGLP